MTDRPVGHSGCQQDRRVRPGPGRIPPGAHKRIGANTVLHFCDAIIDPLPGMVPGAAFIPARIGCQAGSEAWSHLRPGTPPIWGIDLSPALTASDTVGGIFASQDSPEGRSAHAAGHCRDSYAGSCPGQPAARSVRCAPVSPMTGTACPQAQIPPSLFAPDRPQGARRHNQTGEYTCASRKNPTSRPT